MNLGNRKKKPEDEYIPVWTKRCDLQGLECRFCSMYSKRKQWCIMYEEELIDLLQQGKKLRPEE